MTVDYRDPYDAPLEDRVAAAEAAGDIQWSMALKGELRRQRAAEQHDENRLDFRDKSAPAGAPTLRQQIAAAEEIGDVGTSMRLKRQLAEEIARHRASRGSDRAARRDAVSARIDERNASAVSQAGNRAVKAVQK